MSTQPSSSDLRLNELRFYCQGSFVALGGVTPLNTSHYFTTPGSNAYPASYAVDGDEDTMYRVTDGSGLPAEILLTLDLGTDGCVMSWLELYSLGASCEYSASLFALYGEAPQCEEGTDCND